MIDDETFFAWLDGELAPEEAARVEAAVAADPELSRLAEEHRAMSSGLRGAFGAVEAQQVPERLQHAARGRASANVVDFAQAAEPRGSGAFSRSGCRRRTGGDARRRVFAGNLMTRSLFGGGSSNPIQAESGRLVASADLENALYARLASAPAESRPAHRD